MKFVEILKDILVELNLNQTQLAKKIGIKPKQISEWLSEKAKPRYDSLRNICIALRISADRLLCLEDIR